MRFLFTSLFSNDLGLPTSTLPIAVSLQKRGHEVAACNPAVAPSRLIAEAGLENLPIRQRRPTVYAANTSMVWDIDHFEALNGMLDERYVRETCTLLREVIEAHRPDVIVDSWNPCVCMVAAMCGVPLVTIIHSYIHPLSPGFIWWRERPEKVPSPVEVINRVLVEQHSMPVGRAADLHIGDLTLVHGLPATDPLPPEADVTHIGVVMWQRPAASLPAEVEDHLGEEPVIWIYTGNPRYGAFPSWADSIEVFRLSVEALADLPVRVVITTGFHPLPKNAGALPANFLHLPYVPAIEMAKRSSLILHHGGYNSCQLGLITGTPSLVLPTFSEREGNARRIARLGAGEFIVPGTEMGEQEHTVLVQRLRMLVFELLYQPGYHEQAQRVGKMLLAEKGPDWAAEIIEQVL